MTNTTPLEAPNDIALKPEAQSDLQKELELAIDPIFHQSNRYRHGYANGIVRMLNIICGEEKPPMQVEAYTDELAADANLGHEALVLIEAFLKADDAIALTELRRRMGKLVQTWNMNTWTKANIPEVPASTPKEPAYLLIDGKRHEIYSASELPEIPEVAAAIEDKPGQLFVRFETIKNVLVAVFSDGIAPPTNGFYKVGKLSGNVACLNLERRAT
jgi:hypothetical protein